MNSLPAFFPSAKRKPAKTGIFFRTAAEPGAGFPVPERRFQNPAGLLNPNLFYVEFLSSNLAIFTRFLKALFFGEKKAAFCFTFFFFPVFLRFLTAAVLFYPPFVNFLTVCRLSIKIKYICSICITGVTHPLY